MRSDAREFLDLVADFEELGAAEIVLAKEVYAHFGLAFYVFALVEHALINAVQTNRLYEMYAAKQIKTADEWTAHWDTVELEVHALTFGNLAREIQKIPEFSDLADQIGAAKNNRDYFAHRFFRETSSLHLSEEGCRLLLVRMSKTRTKLEALDTTLSERFRTMCHRMRLPPFSNAKLLEASAKLTADASALIALQDPELGWKP